MTTWMILTGRTKEEFVDEESKTRYEGYGDYSRA